MWCPKCKNEYRNGIVRCADCDAELVAALTEDVPVFGETSVSLRDTEEASYNLEENEAVKSRVYISKRTQQEDIRSTAYTFIVVSVIGAAFLVLFALGVIPLHMAGYMKVLSCVVMGSMFLVFFIIGIRSFIQLKTVKKEAMEEEQFFKELTDWYKSVYSASAADFKTDTDFPKEQLYFIRYAIMKNTIEQNYPDLEESFLDHVIEQLYTELFGDEAAD